MHEELSYFHADESVYYADEQQGRNLNVFKAFCDSGF